MEHEGKSEFGYHDPEGNLTAEDAKHLDRMWAAFDELREYLNDRYPQPSYEGLPFNQVDPETAIELMRQRQHPIYRHLLAMEMNLKGVAFQLATQKPGNTASDNQDDGESEPATAENTRTCRVMAGKA
jgi:hypothetical protein